jgi:hypothetical protein
VGSWHLPVEEEIEIRREDRVEGDARELLDEHLLSGHRGCGEARAHERDATPDSDLLEEVASNVDGRAHGFRAWDGIEG